MIPIAYPHISMKAVFLKHGREFCFNNYDIIEENNCIHIFVLCYGKTDMHMLYEFN